ncbi:hypothetical protein K458DRAFT_384873 [Lentithecium fluviatile CBS 122367]|uniref:Uncharacterized protein n=1 Tax=Lentithecium fluviatile CBS 122367 TaxID=1168545 RepID=A0A6G1JDY9_9PLEO|nr:hypothetical protein K458DRAFT_384873 [Lentithecium fluviatile CBS 122367]
MFKNHFTESHLSACLLLTLLPPPPSSRPPRFSTMSSYPILPTLLTLLTLLLALLLPLATADNLTGALCTCSSSTYRGYTFSFTFTPFLLPNSTPSIHDDCIAEMGPGGYDQDLTYLKKYSTAQHNHTFRYHRDLWGPDEYEFDGSGARKVPAREARVWENFTA